MDNLAENYLIRFKNLTKKKEAIFANFQVKGIRSGVTISAAISVDISALDLHAGDVLEKIIEECAKRALKEFKKSDFQFEDFSQIKHNLGVAQLG
ncbi:MAG: hypothetical protein WCP39_03990 [Chlamydiota bacterium]